MTTDKYLEPLEEWADALRRLETQHHSYKDHNGTGIEIVFDGLCEWTYNVKVRRPWRLFGQDTRELFLIYEKGLRVPLATSGLAADLVASKVGSHVSDELDRYVDSFNRDFATPEDVGWTNGEDESPPDYPFSAFSWAEHSEQLSKLKGGSFVSRYIMGFEGKENDLVYINRQRNFSDFEENAELGRIFPSVSPRVSIDGVLIEASETTDLFKLASQLLPEEWI